MKIAIPYESGMVFQHFGHTAEFKFYEVENGQVTASEVVSINGQGHGALVGFLAQHNANVVFCGGIGPGAQKMCIRDRLHPGHGVVQLLGHRADLAIANVGVLTLPDQLLDRGDDCGGTSAEDLLQLCLLYTSRCV